MFEIVYPVLFYEKQLKSDYMLYQCTFHPTPPILPYHFDYNFTSPAQYINNGSRNAYYYSTLNLMDAFFTDIRKLTDL